MKKSSLVALALAALAHAASATADSHVNRSIVTSAEPFGQAAEMTAYRHVAQVAVVSLRGRSVLEAVELEAGLARPLVELQRADQYALRQIDRQRPEVTPAWRECLSV